MSEIEDVGHLPEVGTEITYISASIQDSKEISTAIPMFSGSGNTERLVRRQSDVRICKDSIVAAINRKWI